MIASCGMRALRLRIVEKMNAPRNVNARLTQYAIGECGIAASYGQQQSDGRAQRRNLRQRKVDEDHAPFDDVNSKIGVNSSQYQAGDERRRQKSENGCVHDRYFAPVFLMASTSRFRS